MQRRINKLTNRPHVIGDSKRDRWCGFGGFVHAAKIVVGDEQGESGGVVFEFLAKAVRQPREATACHSQS
jgi:hypothetical protein